MKVTNQELREMSDRDVAVKVEELRRELFKLRISARTSPDRSYPSKKQALRRSIARALTHLRQRQLQSS